MPFIGNGACVTCGLPLPGTTDEDTHCDFCLADPPPWARGVAVALYGGRARQIVLGLKHGDRGDLVPLVARWLAGRARRLQRSDTVVVPVPLHRLRFLRRRSNQSADMARAFCRLTGAEYLPDALVRTRSTPSQDGRDRTARFANVDSAFAVDPARAARFLNRPVLLIDDVMTTGATLTACTRALEAAGVTRIDVAVLARVERPH